MYVVPMLLIVARGRSTVPCDACNAQHYLAVREERGSFDVYYDRYTGKYPIDDDDDDENQFVARCFVARDSPRPAPEADAVSGPIMIYPRKRRFSPSELRTIWRASARRCHLCGRVWRLNERGGAGWHIDHVIPHVGGGPDVEEMPNFRVACAACNLKKGRGFTSRDICIGLKRLIDTLQLTIHPQTRSLRLARPLR